MRVGDCKAIRSTARVPQACCFCEATIPAGDKAIKFVERPGPSQDVVVTYVCLPCWREMRRDLAIDTPTPAERSDRP
jgi:hypothetical protein